MGRFVSNRELKSQSYSIRLPQATSSFPYGNPSVSGEIRYNTTNNQIEYWDGSAWQIIAKVGNSTIVKDSQGAASPGSNLVAADGSRTTFTMSQSYTSGQEAQVLVYVGNIFQNPGVAYTFNGTTTITFTSPPPLGQTIIILHNFASTSTP